MTLEDLLALDRWGLLEEPDPDEQLLEDLRLLQLLEALQQPDAPHGHEHHRP